MKTRNTNFFKSILVFALVIGSILSAAPTVALAENNNQISPISEYYATYYGEAGFENFAMTSYAPAPSEVFYANNFAVVSEKSWSTVGEYYANLNGNVAFENLAITASEPSPSEIFYANYYGDAVPETQLMATFETSPIKLFYADYYSSVTFD